MIPFALVFIASFLVDCIPVFAPPAWMFMLFFMMKFDLNPYVVVSVGTCGTVGGRLVYSQFIVPWVGRKTLGRSKESDLKYLGKKLSGRGWAMMSFVFLYSILPLSTTALFTAAGLARVKVLYIIVPFFFGNLIGDAITLLSAKTAIQNFGDFYQGSLDPKNVAFRVLGVLVVLAVLFVDWRQLLEKRKLRFDWKIWK